MSPHGGSRTTTLSRRHALGLLGALSPFLHFREARAARRTPYGGTLRLSLPLNLTTLDPHDPHDLTCALLGPSLFESLYSLTTQGVPYPTLADSMPQAEGKSLVVTLRKGMSFSSGAALTAREVVASLTRSQKNSPHLRALGTPTFQKNSSLLIRFKTNLTSKKLALLLSELRSCILPRDYKSSHPVSCGALQVERTGRVLSLKRNPRAVRGGSFFSRVVIKSATPVESLRAFEATHSDLGFLGSGLHQARKNTLPFRLSSPGVAVLKPGKGIEKFAQPGMLETSLTYMHDGPFSALGVKRGRASARRFSGPQFTILVCKDEPWLIQIATELARAWSRVDFKIELETNSRAQLKRRQNSGNFDALVTAVSNTGNARQLMNDLFRLDARKPPRSGRVLSPHEASRRLRLGVIGEFRAQGAILPHIKHLASGQYLDLANSYFETET